MVNWHFEQGFKKVYTLDIYMVELNRELEYFSVLSKIPLSIGVHPNPK